jgi:hypothetical protein
MPNAIKYNTNAETLALKKGNFWIGNGAVGKGPTSSTGYYNGVAIPSGGYVIYSYTSSLPGNIAYFAVANDSQLISYTNGIAGASYTGVNQCFTYYYSQTDKVCVSQDYPSDFPYIVLDGLILYLDAGITLSYPGNGTTWTDVNGLGPKNNGTLNNGPTYNSANGGSIVFDGSDDYVSCGNIMPSIAYTKCVWFNITQMNATNNLISGGGNGTHYFYPAGGQYLRAGHFQGAEVQSNTAITDNVWYHGAVTFSTTSGFVIYQNGATVGTNASTATFTGGNVVNIGSYNPAENLLRGRIGVAQVYNRVLSQTEILQNYNAQKSRFGL